MTSVSIVHAFCVGSNRTWTIGGTVSVAAGTTAWAAKVGITKKAHQQVVMIAALHRSIHYERFVVQVCRRNFSATCQRVVVMHSQHHAIARDDQSLHQLPIDGSSQYPDVDPARRKRFDLVGRDHFLKDQFDLRQLAPHQRYNAWQKFITAGWYKAQRQNATFAACHPAGGKLRFFGEPQNPLGVGQKPAAGGGECNCPV